MTLRPFPVASRVRWRRLDVPGREEARIDQMATGWRLTGALDVEEAGVTARLRYRIDCDPEWRTRAALVEGEAGGRPIRVALAADGGGQWTRDGAPLPELAGALDVDFGFTPATNTLPIRRLALAVGATAPVRSAWLRFPELRLEPLEQTYIREADQVFRYRALVDGEPFVARLDTDPFGRVVRYEGLWEMEVETERSVMPNASTNVTVETLQAFADAWNRHDADALMSFMTEDCVFEASAGPETCGTRYVGRDAVRAGYVDVWTNFPDAHWGGARHFVHGDRGVSQWTFTGTRADGTRVEVHGCDLFTFRDGRIALKDSYRKNRPSR